MKLTKEKLNQIIQEELEKVNKELYSEGAFDGVFNKDTAAMAAGGALAGLPLAMNAIASGGHPGIALPLIAMANGAVVGALTHMVAPGLLNKATKVFKSLGGKAKEELKDLGKKIGLNESSELTEKTLKEFQESLREMLDDDYDNDNPPAAEMMADAMQDGLKKLMPKYDMDIDMERRVHDAVMEFARELHELMNFPEIKVDSDRYFGPED